VIFESSQSEWNSRVLSILRIVVALLFIEHGMQKLFGFPPATPPRPTVELMSQFGLAGVLETFGGLAILLGLFTRPIAFLLCGEMAVAYFQAHFPHGFYPINNMGEPPVLFCFIFLYFVFSGAGVWSIDAILARSRRAHRPTPSHDRSSTYPR
jgi:putative oxidoreductase